MENEPGEVDPERQRSAREYARIQRRLAILETALGFLYLAGWVASGLSLLVRERLAVLLPASATFPGRTFSGWVAIGLLVLLEGAVIAAPWWIATLPLDFYSTFLLPHRYQISTQSLSLWISDQGKQLGLTLALGIPLLLFLNLFLRAFPVWWWLGAGLGYILLSLLLTLLAPVVLLPVFYHIQPLGQEWKELSERLVHLANAAGARVNGVYVFDMSRRTKAANAALTGLAGTRRILLSDTLLAHFAPDEIETVLAHELGHQVHRDIPLQLVTQSVLILGSLFAGSVTLRWSIQAFGYQGVGDPAALPALAVSLGLISLLLLPALNSLSRWRESLADTYALQATDKPAAFERAMSRLADQNLAEVDPPGWVVALFYSHPPLAARLEKARRFALQEGSAEAPSPHARAGVRLFNEKRFFEAHEELELAWRSEPRQARNVYQGILQLGLAWYQVSRRNYRGAMNMLERAEFWLERAPSPCLGINVEQVRAQASRLKSELATLGLARITQVDWNVFSPIPISPAETLDSNPRQAGVRGADGGAGEGQGAGDV